MFLNRDTNRLTPFLAGIFWAPRRAKGGGAGMSSLMESDMLPKDISRTQGSTIGSDLSTSAVYPKVGASSTHSSTNSSPRGTRSPPPNAQGAGAASLQVEQRFRSKSFWLWSTSNPIRAFCIAVVSNRYFKLFILLSIIVNSIFLAINDPLKGTYEGFNAVCRYADYIFLAIFATEALMKIIAMGLIVHKGSYLRGAPSVFFIVLLCASSRIALCRLVLNDATVKLKALSYPRVIRCADAFIDCPVHLPRLRPLELDRPHRCHPSRCGSLLLRRQPHGIARAAPIAPS